MDTPAVYPRTLLAPLLTTDPDAWLALQLRTPPELLVRQRHLLARSRAAALPIDYVGIFSLFAGYRFYPGTHHDWVFINAADDPLLHNRDGFPLPRHIRQQLHQFTQAGLEFDALYLAHELPPGSLTADTSVSGDLLAPPPPAAVQRLSRHCGQVSRWLWYLVSAPVLATGVLVGTTALGVLAPIVGLDPILFGAIVAPGRPVVPDEPAALFYLTHWAYNEELEK